MAAKTCDAAIDSIGMYRNLQRHQAVFPAIARISCYLLVFLLQSAVCYATVVCLSVRLYNVEVSWSYMWVTSNKKPSEPQHRQSSPRETTLNFINITVLYNNYVHRDGYLWFLRGSVPWAAHGHVQYVSQNYSAIGLVALIVYELPCS